MKILLRTGVCWLAGFMLAGCNSLTGVSYDTIKLAISGSESVITTDLINELDQPALIVRLGDSEALLVRASRYGQTSEWQGAGQALVIRNGRLVQTAGIPDGNDVLAPLLPDDPFLGDLRAADGTEVTRLVDLPSRYLTGIPQQASYKVDGTENLEIMGQDRKLVRIEERVRMPVLNMQTTNLYWLDPANGQVVASRQQLTPELAPLFLTEVTPMGSQP